MLRIKSSWSRHHIQRRWAHIGRKRIDHEKTVVSKIRNIGILAHIDAGKTTTTERMLYYSGLIESMGEVHRGNTVTDYMDQERQRGITITAAAVTFNWKDYRINLIDTPGHIDFTMEVEQTLRVLDGAVIILDGSAGVEAQTITVSRQADKYNIPRIIYVNKMDRADADLDMCLSSIQDKLCVETLPTQLPLRNDGVFEGIVNVVTMEKYLFHKENRLTNYSKSSLTEATDGRTWESARELRRLLTDKLSSIDDELANIVIEQESLDQVKPQDLTDALRRSTISRKGVPILLGSSYKNVGVQPLMDGVLLYLPSPATNDRLKFYKHFRDNLSARVFKIVHDKIRGPMTYLRIYTGSLRKSGQVYNVQRTKTEQAGRLYVACADDYEDVTSLGPGNIAAVTGLKSTVTGDLITAGAKTADKARSSMEESDLNIPEIEEFFAACESSVEPVYFCSIEPPTMSEQKALDIALTELCREDPSLRVVHDEENLQTILGGMGELHIDIIKERIRREYKVDVDLGPLQVAYKETIQTGAQHTINLDQTIGKSRSQITMVMSLIPNYKEKDILSFDMTSETAQVMSHLPPKRLIAIRQGIATALLHGPKLSCPVINVGVKIHSILYTKESADSVFAAATSQCIKHLLNKCSPILLEPIMQLEIMAPSENSSNIMAEISKRRGEIHESEMRGKNRVFRILAPLSELSNFSTRLRTITSGYATFSMEFSHYQLMDCRSEAETIRRVSGF